MKKAQALDPLSLIINADLAELLLIAHFPEQSVQQSEKTIEMESVLRWPTISWARHTSSKGRSIRQSGNCRRRSAPPRVVRSAQPTWPGPTLRRGDETRRCSCSPVSKPARRYVFECLRDCDGLRRAGRPQSSNDLARSGLRRAVQSRRPDSTGLRSTALRPALPDAPSSSRGLTR